MYKIFTKHTKLIFEVLCILVLSFIIWGFATNWKFINKSNNYQTNKKSESESESECSDDLNWSNYDSDNKNACGELGQITDTNMIAKCRLKQVVNFANSNPDFINPNKGGYAIWRETGPYSGNVVQIQLKDQQIPHCYPAPHVDFLYTWHDLNNFFPNDNIPQLLQTNNEKLRFSIEKISESISIDPLSGIVRIRCHHLGANFATLYLILQYMTNNSTPNNAEYKNSVIGYITNWNHISQLLKTNGNDINTYLQTIPSIINKEAEAENYTEADISPMI